MRRRRSVITKNQHDYKDSLDRNDLEIQSHFCEAVALLTSAKEKATAVKCENKKSFSPRGEIPLVPVSLSRTGETPGETCDLLSSIAMSSSESPSQDEIVAYYSMLEDQITSLHFTWGLFKADFQRKAAVPSFWSSSGKSAVGEQSLSPEQLKSFTESLHSVTRRALEMYIKILAYTPAMKFLTRLREYNINLESLRTRAFKASPLHAKNIASTIFFGASTAAGTGALAAAFGLGCTGWGLVIIIAGLIFGTVVSVAKFYKEHRLSSRLKVNVLHLEKQRKSILSRYIPEITRDNYAGFICQLEQIQREYDEACPLFFPEIAQVPLVFMLSKECLLNTPRTPKAIKTSSTLPLSVPTAPRSSVGSSSSTSQMSTASVSTSTVSTSVGSLSHSISCSTNLIPSSSNSISSSTNSIPSCASSIPSCASSISLATLGVSTASSMESSSSSLSSSFQEWIEVPAKLGDSKDLESCDESREELLLQSVAQKMEDKKTEDKKTEDKKTEDQDEKDVECDCLRCTPCYICAEAQGDLDVVFFPSCDQPHLVHGECLKRWQSQSDYNGACCICRRKAEGQCKVYII